MDERKFDIATDDGAMNTFVCYPDEGGPFPVIFFFHDAPGIREELFEMARRIGSCGYYVIMPNFFYRAARDVVIDGNRADLRGTYDNELMLIMIGLVSNAMAIGDTRATLATIAKDPMAKPGPIGAVGYCMGGRFAVCAAAECPEIAVTAAYCATMMMTDQDDSPHRVVGRIKSEVYFGCGESDPLLPPEHIEALRAAMEAGGRSSSYRNLSRCRPCLRICRSRRARSGGGRSPLGADVCAVSQACRLGRLSNGRTGRRPASGCISGEAWSSDLEQTAHFGGLAGGGASRVVRQRFG